MVTRNTLSASSHFLVGVSTAVIVLQFIARQLIPFPIVSDTDTLTAFEHLKNWILIGLGESITLAILMLATWVGQLLQMRFPNPSKSTRWALWSVALIALVLYIYGTLTRWLPPCFFGGCFVDAILQGYLVKVDRLQTENSINLIPTCAALALAFLGFHCIERHRWLSLFVILPFAYYTLRLSYDTTIQRLMEKPWVWPTIKVLSILAFLCAIYYLICSWTWLSYDYLIPIWCVILQPMVVYPFIRLWQKNHKNM